MSREQGGDRPRAWRSRSLWIGCAALAATVVLLFRRVVWFPYLAMGDAPHIVRDPLVNAPNLWGPSYLLTPQYDVLEPWTLFVGKVAFRISDGRPWSYHSFALGLHAVSACLLAALARALGARTASALLGALLFAVHPLVVQPLAWADCLDVMLCTPLTLASTLAWTSLHVAPRARVAAAAALLAMLAMLSHPSAALLGAAWMLGMRGTAGHAPGANQALAAGSRVLATRAARVVVVLGALVAVGNRFSHPAVLTVAREAEVDAWSVLAVGFDQLRRVVWPHDLLPLHPIPAAGPSPSAFAGLVPLVLLACAVLAPRAPRYVRLPAALVLAHALAALALAPVQHVARDAHVYLPLALMLLAATAALDAALARARPAARYATALLALALSLGLARGARTQLEVWRGGDALFAPVLRAHPHFPQAYDAYAEELAFNHELGRAAQVLARGHQLAPSPAKLLRIGRWLGAAGQLADAECVLLSAARDDALALQAETAYAALLALHRDFEPRDAAVAHGVLTRIAELHARDELHWPHLLRDGLHGRLRELRAVPAASRPFSPRECGFLRGRQR